MSFTRFRQSLCFSFFLQSPFFTFVGSKVGVAVGALASHLCDPGSVPVVGTWVEFVVGSGFFEGFFKSSPNFPPSTKTNTSKFQFNLDVKCLHMMCGPHTTTLNLIYLFLLHMLDTYSSQSPFSNLHAICIVWPVSLDFYRIWATKFTCYLQGIEQHHISHLHVLYMCCLKNLQDIYKEDTVHLFPKIYMLFTWFFKL